MIDLQRRDVFFGNTVTEWLEGLPNELADDAVGLWQIIPNGRRGFGFKDLDLIEFTRYSISTLLANGAKPVVGDQNSPSGWSVTSEYGDKAEDIVDAIIAKWIKGGAIDPDVEDVWFATQEFTARS